MGLGTGKIGKGGKEAIDKPVQRNKYAVVI